jgi:hypothetical protein
MTRVVTKLKNKSQPRVRPQLEGARSRFGGGYVISPLLGGGDSSSDCVITYGVHLIEMPKDNLYGG